MRQRAISKPMDKYEVLDKIGEGSYGKVFKGRVRATGQMVALKKTEPQNPTEGIPTSTLREIASLKKLSRYEHIVKYERMNPVMTHIFISYSASLIKN